MNASHWIPWGPSRWAWEAEAGQSAILHTKTTPSIVNVTIFPCVASLIIASHSQTPPKKRPHWGRRNEENVRLASFSLLSLPLFLSTNIVLCAESLGTMPPSCQTAFLCACVMRNSLRWFCENRLWCSSPVSCGSMLGLFPHEQVQRETRFFVLSAELQRDPFVESLDDLWY